MVVDRQSSYGGGPRCLAFLRGRHSSRDLRGLPAPCISGLLLCCCGRDSGQQTGARAGGGRWVQITREGGRFSRWVWPPTRFGGRGVAVGEWAAASGRRQTATAAAVQPPRRQPLDATVLYVLYRHWSRRCRHWSRRDRHWLRKRLVSTRVALMRRTYDAAPRRPSRPTGGKVALPNLSWKTSGAPRYSRDGNKIRQGRYPARPWAEKVERGTGPPRGPAGRRRPPPGHYAPAAAPPPTSTPPTPWSAAVMRCQAGTTIDLRRRRAQCNHHRRRHLHHRPHPRAVIGTSTSVGAITAVPHHRRRRHHYGRLGKTPQPPSPLPIAARHQVVRWRGRAARPIRGARHAEPQAQSEHGTKP